MTVLSGQNENAGHFLQPTTRAIGHKVMVRLLCLLMVCLLIVCEAKDRRHLPLGHGFDERIKKTDVAEHSQVFHHVGLLFNKPPGDARLLFIQSSETLGKQAFVSPASTIE